MIIFKLVHRIVLWLLIYLRMLENRKSYSTFENNSEKFINSLAIFLTIELYFWILRWRRSWRHNILNRYYSGNTLGYVLSGFAFPRENNRRILRRKSMANKSVAIVILFCANEWIAAVAGRFKVRARRSFSAEEISIQIHEFIARELWL